MDKSDLSFIPTPEWFLKPIIHSESLLSIAHNPHVIELNMLKAEVHLEIHYHLFPNSQFSFCELDFFSRLFSFATLYFTLVWRL